MVSKLWTYFGVLICGTDHGQDRTYRKQSHIERPHRFPSHRRLLNFTLMIILLVHLCLLPSVIGAKVGSSKRRITGSNGGKTLAEWDDIFQQRTDGDWRDLWHKERHRRCQHQLLSHMEVVCEKDIYKLARRRRKKRDLAGSEGSELGPEDSQQEDFDGGVATYVLLGTDSDLGSRSLTGSSMVNMTTLSMKQNDLPKHPLFSTYKEANLFGRRQLLKTRKRQLNSGINNVSGNLVAVEAKRSSRLERAKRGISDECCSGTDGCSWEEYAEYCPANVRIRTSVN